MKEHYPCSSASCSQRSQMLSHLLVLFTYHLVLCFYNTHHSSSSCSLAEREREKEPNSPHSVYYLCVMSLVCIISLFYKDNNDTVL